jgi:hypothetical protein
MAVVGKLYGKAILSLFNSEMDWDSDSWKCMLTTSGYSPDQDVHDYKDDVSSEVSGTGYTAGGATLANKTITYTAGTNTIKLDADDVSWPGSTITARTAVVYDDTPATAATKPLLCYQQSDADVSSTAGTFSVVWNASGICEVVVA